MRSNLLKNLEGIYESRGRTEGAHSVYIPPEPPLSEGGGGGGGNHDNDKSAFSVLDPNAKKSS